MITRILIALIIIGGVVWLFSKTKRNRQVRRRKTENLNRKPSDGPTVTLERDPKTGVYQTKESRHSDKEGHKT